ncbi:MAG: hypothetical protein ABSA45_04310 [Verrucomicrobiota bacterium]|jgi:hypothetical protein
MSASVDSAFAWEPLTPRGVAAFAHARPGRLLLVQFIVAVLTSAAVDCFLHMGCFPTITAAIKQLPDQGEIRAGRLNWHGESPALLAEGGFLAFDVDLEHAGQIHSPAQMQIEFGRESVRVISLLGYADFRYPSDQPLYFDRTDLEPLWDAWKPDILGIATGAVVVGLMLAWTVMATVYFLPVWLFCFFADRDLNFRQCWRLAGAALMPGALLLAATIAFYALGALDLIQMSFAFGAHLVLGWIYLFISPLFLTRTSPTEKRNPFTSKS